VTVAEIDIIRRIEAKENDPPPIEVLHNYKPGDMVRLIEDIYALMPPAKVIALLRGGRIKVEVQLMRRAVLIEVYPHQIEAM
jgi:transcription antitermination factor NusG